MAGHRKATGKPRKDVAAAMRTQARIAAAATPAERVAAAFDGFRQTCARMGKAGRSPDAAMDAMTEHLMTVTASLSAEPARLHVVSAAGGSAERSAV